MKTALYQMMAKNWINFSDASSSFTSLKKDTVKLRFYDKWFNIFHDAMTAMECINNVKSTRQDSM